MRGGSSTDRDGEEEPDASRGAEDREHDQAERRDLLAGAPSTSPIVRRVLFDQAAQLVQHGRIKPCPRDELRHREWPEATHELINQARRRGAIVTHYGAEDPDVAPQLPREEAAFYEPAHDCLDGRIGDRVVFRQAHMDVTDGAWAVGAD